MKKRVWLNVCDNISMSHAVRRVLCKETAHEHFADEMAWSEADDETNDHSCEDGNNCLVHCSNFVHLEVIRGEEG